MSPNDTHCMPMTEPHRVRAARAALPALAAMLWGATVLSAPVSGNGMNDANSPDRTMEFIERSVQATDLFNQRMLVEALQAFEQLMQDYSDLDEDGYVAVSLADCLAGLGRNDEARAVYASVVANHAEMAQSVQQRLWEMDLAGEVDGALVDELRTAAATQVENLYAVKVQLGRALQKRALATLSEAIVVLRDAAATNANQAQPTRRLVSRQAEMLVELKEDLNSLIDRVERGWAGMKTIQQMIDAKEAPHDVQGCRSEWTSRFSEPGGSQGAAPGNSQDTVKLETQWQDDGSVKALANGRTVRLNASQELIIRRHQERINAILLEAARSSSPAAPSRGDSDPR